MSARAPQPHAPRTTQVVRGDVPVAGVVPRQKGSHRAASGEMRRARAEHERGFRHTAPLREGSAADAPVRSESAGIVHAKPLTYFLVGLESGKITRRI